MHVPDEVRDAARAAFRTHVPGRELLPQVDGADEADEGQARTLCFSDGGMSVAVDVEPGGDGLMHLVVELKPPGPAEVEVQHPDPALVLVVRGPSPLRVAAVPGGLTRLVVTMADDPSKAWHTSWFRL